MTTFNIKQIQEMVGMVIPRVEVRITKVYERKTGKGQYGEWSLQNGEVEDSTGRMKVLFKQLPSQAHLQGKTMIFKSMEGKHGLKGVEVKKNEYNGKTTLELHVSNAALIVGNGEETITEPVETTRMPQIEPQMASEAPINHDQRKLGLGVAKNRYTQFGGLFDIAWKTAKGTEYFKYLQDLQLTSFEREDLIMRLSMNFAIQGEREGLADKMPVRTLSKFYNEEEVKPASAKHRGDPAEQEEMEGKPDLEESDIPF